MDLITISFMSSIGSNIRNFFSTTVKADNYKEGEIHKSDSDGIHIDKSLIRKALIQGFGFFGMLKGMKAIRQHNGDLTQLLADDSAKQQLGKIGQAIEFIHKAISERKLTDVSLFDFGTTRSYKASDEVKTIEKLVKGKIFTKTLEQYTNMKDRIAREKAEGKRSDTEAKVGDVLPLNINRDENDEMIFKGGQLVVKS